MVLPDQNKGKSLLNFLKSKTSKLIDVSSLDKFDKQIVGDDFYRIKHNDVGALKSALNKGPVAL